MQSYILLKHDHQFIPKCMLEEWPTVW